jgi:hypothetical protein
MTLHWPQIAILILAGMSLGIHIARNGEHRNDKFSASFMFIATVFEMWLLYCGGFFGQ